MRNPLGWLLRRRARDAEWREEIESHIELRREWNQARGLGEEPARRMARKQFGNALSTLEQVRGVHVYGWVDNLRQDIRYAARGFWKSPAFSIVAIATLATGIAASTAVFSIVDPLLFRPLPYPNAGELVSLGYFGPVDTNEFNVVSSYLEWRARQTPFLAITSMRASSSRCDVQVADAPQQLLCYAVESTFLKTFGIVPLLGRDFTAEDDRPGAPTVILLSYAMWQSQFGGNRGALGKVVMIDDQPARVIGVLPKTFEMPQRGDVDLLIPERLNSALPRAVNSSSALRTFARLRPGMSIDGARQAMQPLFQETARTDTPATLLTEVRLVVRSLRDRQIHEVKLASWMLLGAVLALLLVACANVANLLLARAAARRRELALRAAIGAGRARLIRQMITESLMLGLSGGLAGCGGAWLLVRFLIRLAPEGLLRLSETRIDLRVLLFTAAVSLFAAVLSGIGPAFDRPRPESLAGWQTAGSVRTSFRKILVAAQVAISLMLLSGGFLFLRSLWRLENQAYGFRPEHVVTASFTLREQRYRAAHAQTAFFQQVESRLRHIPGAGSFALSDSIPPGGPMMGRPYSNLRIAGHPPVSANGGLVAFRWVTPGYFEAMGIPILAGRAFTEEQRAEDDSPLILSATLAHRLFGDENPIGQQIDLNVSGHWLPVVGVAADVKNGGLAETPDPEYYRLRTNDASQLPRGAVAIFRTALDPATLSRWIRREVADLDPTLPVTVETMDTRVGRFTSRPRFIALLVSLFAVCSLLLAAAGLYGVLSFLVAQQTREIGVRVALGARPRDIVLQVQRRAGAWTAAGILTGLAGAFAVTRLIQGLLFEVAAYDPLSLATAGIMLLAITGIAAWAPSRRAARVDPIVALRHD